MNYSYEQIHTQDTQADIIETLNEAEASFRVTNEDYHPLMRTEHENIPGYYPTTMDGVFSNIPAKPESTMKEEDLPSYETAVADSTPTYWQTTIIAPSSLGDVVLVEGLPVGHPLGFIWNLFVSSSFQLVGFMLTYVLHTTHAAKNGACAGLGVSLIQYGFYVRSRGTLDEDFDYDGEGHERREDTMEAGMTAYLMMFVGWFIILKSIIDYNRVRRMEKIIITQPIDSPV
ncbi:hypothetical protein BDB01DRAFT_794080 [Pilobolus umbonatus]|nr:hypothetical protein BDB01DRAFT_794080 [Pilobolus umbonatus]